MLYSRDPLFTMLSDKLLVRDYVTRKVGSDFLIPLLWQGENPAEIPFDRLPLNFVIKSNHGCGYNLIINNKTQLICEQAIALLKKWLGENFCDDKYAGTEWAYKHIKPRIIVESMLENDGKAPVDYKFFCFSGRVEYVQISLDRFGPASERICDRELTPLNLWNGVRLFEGEIVQPGNYREMVGLAEQLAEDLDFIRVDLYSTNDHVYFGEMTCYHAGGLAPFIPRAYDFVFGEKWIIK